MLIGIHPRFIRGPFFFCFRVTLCVVFLFQDPADRGYRAAYASLTGAPVRVDLVRGLRDRRGPVHAGSFPPRTPHRARLHARRVSADLRPRGGALHLAAPGQPGALALRRRGARRNRRAAPAGNWGGARSGGRTRCARTTSAARTRRWREYCCESFCDTAAWLYSGLERHEEFTLARTLAQRGAAWFAESLDNRTLSI